MTVPKTERNPNIMNVQNEAIELAMYTLQEINKETILPKRYHWSLGNKIIETTLSLTTNLDCADTFRLDTDFGIEERKRAQTMAIANCFSLVSMVRIAQGISNFPLDKEKYWVDKIVKVRNQISAWMESDRKRVEEMKKK